MQNSSSLHIPLRYIFRDGTAEYLSYKVLLSNSQTVLGKSHLHTDDHRKIPRLLFGMPGFFSHSQRNKISIVICKSETTKKHIIVWARDKEYAVASSLALYQNNKPTL